MYDGCDNHRYRHADLFGSGTGNFNEMCGCWLPGAGGLCGLGGVRFCKGGNGRKRGGRQPKGRAAGDAPAAGFGGVKQLQGLADSEPSSSKPARTLSGVLPVERRILARSVSICSESRAGLTLEAAQFLHLTGTSTTG